MKVLLVNQSDSLGGAAVVTYRLLRALLREGVDAKMLVMNQRGCDALVTPAGSHFSHAVAFGMERWQIANANGFDRNDLFKVSTGHFSVGISSHPWVKEADIICLNWVNQGLSSAKDISRLHKMGKKIIWTMHDMWPFTGICHHAYECPGYLKECGNCPFLGHKAHKNDLSHRVWQEKMRYLQDVPITYVAVSSWLAKRARESSLLRDKEVITIPNAFPAQLYKTSSPNYIKGYDREETPNIILMGAARLDDPIKGLDYAIDALNIIFDSHPEMANKSLALFFGSLRDRSRLDRLHFSHLHLGMVNDPKILRHLYACGKVILSTSLYETLPTTLIEGQAGGCLPVTFDRGGQSDIVEHLKSGYIATYKDPQSVADGILWALNSNIDRDLLHESVVDRFSAPQIARKYITLFNKLME